MSRAPTELPLVLRREPFGGILFEPADATYLELDPGAHALLRAVLGGSGGHDAASEEERAFLATVEAEIPGLRGRRTRLLELDAPRARRFLGRGSSAADPTAAAPLRYATVLSAPTLVDLQLTRRCRQGCPHCYAASTPEGEHMPFAELCRVLDELAQAGVCQLALGGGEPLLHPRIVEILERIRALGMIPNLTTTGDGLDERVLEACARCCGAVALSLEGVGDDFARRRRAGFACFEQSLAALRRHGVRVVFQVTLGVENLPRLPSIVEYCLSVPDLYGVIFLAYKAVGRGVRFDSPLAALPPRELYPRLRDAFLRLSAHTRVGYDCCLTPGIAGIDEELDTIERNLLEGCSAARTSVGISTDLAVVPCTFLPDQPLGSLAERSFLEIWRGPEAEAFRARLDARAERDAECRGCPSQASCLGGCPEWELVRCAFAARSEDVASGG